MTRDDIIRMAQEAELLNPPNDAVNWSAPLPNSDYLQRLERFAWLIMTYNSNRIADWVRDWGDQVSLEKLVEGIRNNGNDKIEEL